MGGTTLWEGSLQSSGGKGGGGGVNERHLLEGALPMADNVLRREWCRAAFSRGTPCSRWLASLRRAASGTLYAPAHIY